MGCASGLLVFVHRGLTVDKKTGLWRIIPLLALLCVLGTPLHAGHPTIGISWTSGGTARIPEEKADCSFVGFSVVIQPWEWEYCNPSLFVEGNVGTRENSLAVHDVNAGLTLTLCRLIDHPLGFLMPRNLTAYAPTVSLSAQYDFESGFPLMLNARLSLIRLIEKDAWYEWFSPFVIINVTDKQLDGWGVALWRFTFLAL